MKKICYIVIIRKLHVSETVIPRHLHRVFDWIKRHSDEVLSSLLESRDAFVIHRFFWNIEGRFCLRATDVMFRASTEHALAREVRWIVATVQLGIYYSSIRLDKDQETSIIETILLIMPV